MITLFLLAGMVGDAFLVGLLLVFSGGAGGFLLFQRPSYGPGDYWPGMALVSTPVMTEG
jgi:hypothetical protein